MEKPAEEEKIIYTPYESLANPHYSESDLPAVMDKILELLKTDHWKNNSDALEQLRILNKYYFLFLITKLDDLDPLIKVTIESLRSGVLKMTLLFLQELAGLNISEYEIRSEALKSYLPKIIPLILIKLLDAKKFISKEAENCMKNVAIVSLSPEVLSTLCNECFAYSGRGAQWNDNVMTYIEMGINQHANFMILEKCKAELFKVISDALNTTRKVMIRQVENIMGILKKKCGPEKVSESIKSSGLAAPDQAKLEEILAGKTQVKKKPEGGLKAFLQSVKHPPK